MIPGEGIKEIHSTLRGLFPALQGEVPKSYDSQVGLGCLFPVVAEATGLNSFRVLAYKPFPLQDCL